MCSRSVCKPVLQAGLATSKPPWRRLWPAPQERGAASWEPRGTFVPTSPCYFPSSSLTHVCTLPGPFPVSTWAHGRGTRGGKDGGVSNDPRRPEHWLPQ